MGGKKKFIDYANWHPMSKNELTQTTMSGYVASLNDPAEKRWFAKMAKSHRSEKVSALNGEKCLNYDRAGMRRDFIEHYAKAFPQFCAGDGFGAMLDDWESAE